MPWVRDPPRLALGIMILVVATALWVIAFDTRMMLSLVDRYDPERTQLGFIVAASLVTAVGAWLAWDGGWKGRSRI